MTTDKLLLALVVLACLFGQPSLRADDFPTPHNAGAGCRRPPPRPTKSRRRLPASARLQGQRLRRRARRPKPRRHDLGQPRPPLGRRMLHLRQPPHALRPHAPRPRHHPGRHRRRRPRRRAKSLLRQRPAAHERRSRPRRRLAHRPAAIALHSRPQRRRHPRRPAGSHPRRLRNLRPTTTTTVPTASAGAPTAGSTAAAAPPAPAGSARRARPKTERTPIYGGIWRYHPTRKIFEVLCHGFTNPWGHDWDEHGEMFITNTVTGHLFHLIPGAHHTRSATHHRPTATSTTRSTPTPTTFTTVAADDRGPRAENAERAD